MTSPLTPAARTAKDIKGHGAANVQVLLLPARERKAVPALAGVAIHAASASARPASRGLIFVMRNPYLDK
jgi:hypothetical protein